MLNFFTILITFFFQVATEDSKIFTFLSKCFIGPGKTEQIKVRVTR